MVQELTAVFLLKVVKHCLLDMAFKRANDRHNFEQPGSYLK